MAWRRSRWASVDVDVSDPFLCHQRPVVLYVQENVVRSHMLNYLSIHLWWITLHASFRSLVVTWPSRLPQETIWALMSAVKCACHMMGCAPASSKFVATVLGCIWGVGGTYVGPGSAVHPHIYLEGL